MKAKPLTLTNFHSFNAPEFAPGKSGNVICGVNKTTREMKTTAAGKHKHEIMRFHAFIELLDRGIFKPENNN